MRKVQIREVLQTCQRENGGALVLLT